MTEFNDNVFVIENLVKRIMDFDLVSLATDARRLKRAEWEGTPATILSDEFDGIDDVVRCLDALMEAQAMMLYGASFPFSMDPLLACILAHISRAGKAMDTEGFDKWEHLLFLTCVPGYAEGRITDIQVVQENLPQEVWPIYGQARHDVINAAPSGPRPE